MDVENTEPTPLLSPVDYIPGDAARAPDPGIAICLSGGGYRAMLFHLGALWRLQEIGYLDVGQGAGAGPNASLGALCRISSVSGGSITSAVLGLNWDACDTANPNARARFAAFETHIVQPICHIAGIDVAGFTFRGVGNVLGAILKPGSINDHVTSSYDEHLFQGATLQDLPDAPRFVLNATNLQSGALWRFMKPYMWDWRVGRIPNPRLSLARAVACSSALPPPLSPALLKFNIDEYQPDSGGEGSNDLHQGAYMTRVELSDGGVYDSLALETAWKHYRTVLVSNGGRPFRFQPSIPINWVSQGSRVFDCVDNQTVSFRKRLLINSFLAPDGSPLKRSGCYWGIESNVENYPARSQLACPFEQTKALASMPTDLAKKDAKTQERLINWGYAICDVAMRSWVDKEIAPATRFPYARAGVG